MATVDEEEINWEELLKTSDDSERIPFIGSEDCHFKSGKKVIVSFPGAYGKAWNFLTRRGRQYDNDFATTCVFLPDRTAEGFGDHVKTGAGCGTCHCLHLYGKQQYFGCAWYDLWLDKTREAIRHRCQLMVVTKRDGSLGRSQEGEVRFLEVAGYTYCQMTIEDFVHHFHDNVPEGKKKMVGDFLWKIRSRLEIKEQARKSRAAGFRRAAGDSYAIVPSRTSGLRFNLLECSEHSIYDSHSEDSGSDTTPTTLIEFADLTDDANPKIYYTNGDEEVIESSSRGESRKKSRKKSGYWPDLTTDTRRPRIESVHGTENEPANNDVPQNAESSEAIPVTQRTSAAPAPPSATLLRAHPCESLPSLPPPPPPPPSFDASPPPVPQPPPTPFDTSLLMQGPDHDILAAMTIFRDASMMMDVLKTRIRPVNGNHFP